MVKRKGKKKKRSLEQLKADIIQASINRNKKVAHNMVMQYKPKKHESSVNKSRRKGKKHKGRIDES